MSNKPVLKVQKSEKQLNKEARQNKLKDLKKSQGKLTLDDMDTKLDIVIEMLTEAAK